MNIILAIIILGLLILVHEFGHFIVAKANGVVVLEFSIGFGPKLLHVKKNDTEYCLKLIPFGGYCLMLGNELIEAAQEEDGEAEKDDKYKNLLKEYDESRTYNNKPVWARIAIELAGPFFNFILAFVGAIVVIGSVGVDPCTIDIVNEDTPAFTAGLQAGDEIISINNDKMSFAREYFFYSNYHEGETMNIVYKRNGEKRETTVIPEYVTSSSYMLGVVLTDNTLISSVSENSAAWEAGLKKGDIIISLDGRTVSNELPLTDILKETGGKTVDIVINRDGKQQSLKVTPKLVENAGYVTGIGCYGSRVKVGPAATIGNAFKEVGYWIEVVIKSVGMMFTGKVGVNDLSGPVGIVDAVSTVVEESKPDGSWYVFLNVTNFIVMLSANLGVMNLLPIPGLDGGKLLFLLIEVLRGKPIKKEHEGMVHLVGMALLMILAVYVFVKDIVNLF